MGDGVSKQFQNVLKPQFRPCTSKEGILRHSKASFLENPCWGRVAKNTEFQNPFGATSGLYFAALLKIIEDDLLLSCFCHVFVRWEKRGRNTLYVGHRKSRSALAIHAGSPQKKSHNITCVTFCLQTGLFGLFWRGLWSPSLSDI